MHLAGCMSVARKAVFTVALVVAGFGCANPESATADETRAPDGPAPASIPSLASIAPVIEVGVDRDHLAPLVVLDVDVASTMETVGLAEYARDSTSESTLVARKALHSGSLSALATVAGTRVQLHAADGSRCDAVLGAPFMVGRVLADDDEGHSPNKPRSDDAEQSVWTSTEGGRALVAPLVGEACVRRVDAGPWLAAAVATPTPYVPEQADAPLRAELLARFRSLPEWNDVAARRRAWDVDTSVAPVASWDVVDGLGPTVVVTTIDGVRHAWASATTDGGCGDFDGKLTVAFIERRGGWTVLSTSEPPVGAPTMAWKTPSGVAWTFSGGSLARPTVDGTLELVTPQIAYRGCGC